MAGSSPSIFEVSCLNWLSRASALLLFSLSLLIDRFGKVESFLSILGCDYHRGLPSINHLISWSVGVDWGRGFFRKSFKLFRIPLNDPAGGILNKMNQTLAASDEAQLFRILWFLSQNKPMIKFFSNQKYLLIKQWN